MSDLPNTIYVWADYDGDIDGHWAHWSNQSDKVPASIVEPFVRQSEKDSLTARVEELEKENSRLNEIINSPENDDFVRGVSIEAEHQIQRWGDDHDKEKNGWDWFWTIGYLSQKAAASFEAGDFEKTQHHCITTAALMKNFHSRVSAALAKGDAHG